MNEDVRSALISVPIVAALLGSSALGSYLSVPLKPPIPSAFEAGGIQKQKAAPGNQPTEHDNIGTADRPLIVKILDPPDADTAANEHKEDRLDETSSKWWNKIFSGLLVVVGFFQIGLLFYTNYVTGRAARAAEKSADAALASMDRPWLFLSDPIHNWSSWLVGEGGLAVIFSLKNYGTAPAFITSISCAVFLNPGHGSRLAEIGDIGDHDIVDIPPPTEFHAFRTSRRRAPRDVDGRIPIRPKYDRIGDPPYKETFAYGAQIIIGANNSSPDYCTFPIRPLKNRESDDLIIECAMHVFFIGEIYYSGPDEIGRHIHFCYESMDGKPFKLHGGPPFNERAENKWQKHK
jgi:hypothetical protein